MEGWTYRRIYIQDESNIQDDGMKRTKSTAYQILEKNYISCMLSF